MIKETKAIQILHKLSNDEKRHFKKFLAIYGSETVNKLFNYIEKQAPEYKDVTTLNERTIKKIFGESDKKGNTVSAFFSKLYMLIGEFIVQHGHQLHINQLEEIGYKELQKREKLIRENLLKLRFYNERTLFSLSQKISSDLDKQFESYPLQNRFYYSKKLEFERQVFFLQGRYQDKRRGDINFQLQGDLLDKGYLLDKMTLLCLMLNRQHVTKTDLHLELFEELVDYFPKSRFKEDTLLGLWYSTLKLVKAQQEPVEFNKIKEIILSDKAILGEFDSRVIFTILENLAKFNVPEQEDYYNTLFEFYEHQIRWNIFKLTKTLIPTLFLNIVTIGLRLGEYDWVFVFLSEYEEELIVEDVEEAKIIKDVAYLSYYVTTKNYKQLRVRMANIDLDKDLRYKDIKNNTAIRRSIIMGWYELGEAVALNDSMNAYKRFISYHKDEIHEPYDSANKLFVNYLARLLAIDKFYSPTKEKDIDELIQDFESEGVVYDKGWIIEKMEEKRNLKFRLEYKRNEICRLFKKYELRYLNRIENVKKDFILLLDDAKLPSDIRKANKHFLNTFEAILQQDPNVEDIVQGYVGIERDLLSNYVFRDDK